MPPPPIPPVAICGAPAAHARAMCRTSVTRLTEVTSGNARRAAPAPTTTAMDVTTDLPSLPPTACDAWARTTGLVIGGLLVLGLAGCGSLRLPAGAESAPVEERGPGAARPAPPTTAAPATPPPQQAARPATPPPAPDVVPRVERIRQGPPNHPYEIRGESYVPEDDDVPIVETGIASWYGRPFHGRRTATGEVYDMHRMTAAHKTMPLPSYAVVRNPANGRQVVVRVNDRGPFVAGRVIDLSLAAARRLGIRGIGRVEVRRLTHAEIRSGAWKLPPQNVARAE